MINNNNKNLLTSFSPQIFIQVLLKLTQTSFGYFIMCFEDCQKFLFHLIFDQAFLNILSPEFFKYQPFNVITKR